MARIAGWAAVLLAVAGAAPALAQSTSDIPPPVRSQVDENGVDLARGEHLVNVTDLSIGPQGLGGLAYVRQLRRTGGGNPYDMGLFQNGSNWTASVGLTSYAFSQSGTTFTSTDGSGAGLVQSGATHILTLGDGTVVLYDYTIRGIGDTNRQARATSLTYASGEEIRLHWVSATWCSNDTINCSGGTLNTAVRLQSVTNSFGHQLHFNYGAATVPSASESAPWSRLDSITAINTTVESCNPTAHSCALAGTWPTVSYSGNNVTDPAGRTSRFTSTANSLAIRRPGSTADDITYTYGSNGLTVVRDGMTWSYSRTVSNNVATMTVTDPGGHSRTIVSDVNLGLPTSVTNEVGQTTTYAYSGGLLSRVTAPEGNYVQYTYDDRGNVTQTQRVAKAASGNATITTSAVFNTCTFLTSRICNQPASTTDALGNVTEYWYDLAHGGLTRMRLPAPSSGAVRPEARFTYSSFQTPGGQTVYRLTGISLCQTQTSCDGSADEVETILAYGTNLLISAVTRRDGTAALSATESYGYDSIGNVITVNGPLSGSADTVRARYNLAREAIGTTSPDPDGSGPLKPRARRVVRHSVTGLVARIESGTVNSQSDADWALFDRNEWIDIDYDQWRRPILRTLMGDDDVAYAATQTGYTGEGLPLCTAIRMNPAVYDELPDGACTHDDPHPVHGPDRISRAYYDAAHRVEHVETGYGTAAVASEVAYTYRSNGTIHTATDASQNRTTYFYDGHDRLWTIRYPMPNLPNASNPDDDEAFGYDANGNLTSFRNRNDQIQGYAYDALDRRIFHDRYGTTIDTSYSYDLLGRMTGASQPNHTLAFTWDALGRQTGETGPLANISSEYDAAGRRTQLDYSPGGFSLIYDYLVTGEMTQVQVGGSSVVATYAYDDRGRRTSLTRGNGVATTYAYDAVSRLAAMAFDAAGTTHDLVLGFGYNHAGQIVSNTRSNDAYAYTGHANQNVTDTINGLNQIVTTGGVAVDHSARGNIIEIGTTDYTYDAQNQLVSSSTGTSLTYDPLGRLYQVSSPTGVRRFVYDGDALIGEYDDAGTNLHRYLHGAGVDEPIAWDDRTQAPTITRRYMHADERGSIIAYTTASDTVTGVNRYDEYGTPEGGVSGRFHYTGQVWIASLGMYYYRARFYHPALGRFMQPDPIGYGSGMNLYAYVHGDPINLIDPTGMQIGLPYSCQGDCPSLYPAGSGTAGSSGEVSDGRPSHRERIVRNPNGVGDGPDGETGGILSDCSVEICVTGTRLREATVDVTLAQLLVPRVGPPPSMFFIRPPWWMPRPPGWNQSWRWGRSIRRPGRSGDEHRWIDPRGGEWRYHGPDRWHPDPHWDYNPNNVPNSPWQHIPIPSVVA